MEKFVILGLAMILIGLILIVAGSVMSEGSNVEAGGVIFLGPIPIPFGNMKMALAGTLLAIVALIVFYLLGGVR
ncbi:MAG: DUF131 domain-containing protein [Candidatus Nanohaloarchaea archaeon]